MPYNSITNPVMHPAKEPAPSDGIVQEVLLRRAECLRLNSEIDDLIRRIGNLNIENLQLRAKIKYLQKDIQNLLNHSAPR